MSLERLNLTADNPKEQIIQIRSYLFQLVEQLELMLDAIDEQNFSAPFIKRMDGIENDIKTIREDIEVRHTVLMNHIRNVSGSSSVVLASDPGVGAEVDYADGTVILVKET